MLAKKNRLNLSLEENTQLFKRGESDFFSTNNLLFYYKLADSFQLAAVAPKRLFDKATSRVKAKRQIYNLFKDLINENQQNTELLKFNLIIVYRQKNLTQDQLKQDIAQALKHYEII